LLRICVSVSLLSFAACEYNDPSRQQAENKPPSTDISAEAEPDNLIARVGRQLAGQSITHVFRLESTGDESFFINSDRDISRNCGCTAIVPATSSLNPRSPAEVKVTVQTNGLPEGAFAKGGSITYRSKTGGQRKVQFTIEGDLVHAFRFLPDAPIFHAPDVRTRVAKEVTITSPLAIDWSSFAISSDSSFFSVVLSHRSENSATCEISCALAENMESLSATLTATARVSDSSVDLAGQTLTASLPVVAHQDVELTVTPNLFPVAFSSPDNSGTGRVLLRGQLLARNDRPIKSIGCDGFQLDWKLSRRADSNSAVLELRLKPEKTLVNERHRVEIDLQDGHAVILEFIPVQVR